MRGLEHFSLQLKSLKNGAHHYHYHIDKIFFELMECQLIREATYDIDIDLHRENKSLEITINSVGHMKTTCDRCTADISLPTLFTSKVYVQINNDPSEDDIETYYIHESETIIDLAPIVYNEISLHLPLVNIYNCEEDNPKPCDSETLDKLEYSDELDTSKEDDGSSPWDALKNIDL